MSDVCGFNSFVKITSLLTVLCMTNILFLMYAYIEKGSQGEGTSNSFLDGLLATKNG